jgi:signal transduction histidine kinase
VGEPERDDPGAGVRRAWMAGAWACTALCAAAAALCLTFFFAWLAPTGGHPAVPSVIPFSAVFAVVVVVGTVTTVPRDRRRADLVAAWARAGAPAGHPARRMALDEPRRQAVASVAFWLTGTALFLVVYAVYSHSPVRAGLATVGAVFAGLDLGAIVFLVSERALRPVCALALRDEPGRPAFPFAVRARMIAAWAAGSGIPILGIALALVWHATAGNTVTGPLWALVLTGLVAGATVMATTAQALARPVEEVRAGLARVQAGHLDTRVAVDCTNEIGDLQAGFNAMVAALREGDRLRAEALAERERGDQLENASRHKSQFLASMSHELRTPLNAIIGFSEVLHEELFGRLNDKQREYVNDILESGRHLLSLINDVLDLTKVEAGRMDLDVRTVDVADMVATAVALFEPEARRRHVTLTVCADPSVGDIDADERMLKQVLLNLLSNAMKFSPEGGRVAVAARRGDTHVAVSVSDEGPGIAPADQERIFEEFQQAATPNRVEGTGLGLALARRFVELHGGCLTVDSELGHGSTFTCRVPIAQPTALKISTQA